MTMAKRKLEVTAKQSALLVEQFLTYEMYAPQGVGTNHPTEKVNNFIGKFIGLLIEKKILDITDVYYLVDNSKKIKR